MITKYKDKKLVEYLKAGGKYRIDWGHGIGDLIMWLPVYERLKELYPDCHFDLYCECGQELIFGTAFDRDEAGYDHVFSLDFPMAEGSNLMKTEKCAIQEMGLTLEQIKDVPEVAELAHYDSPFVSVHFHGTALPGSVGCPESVAKQIWQEIKDYGKIPIEVHFCHVFHNPVNKKFPWVDMSVRNYSATLKNLFGLIQRCYAFVGVASGPFVVALSVMPTRILYLEKMHKIETYTKRDIPKVDVNNYQDGVVKDWLELLEIKARQG